MMASQQKAVESFPEQEVSGEETSKGLRTLFGLVQQYESDRIAKVNKRERRAFVLIVLALVIAAAALGFAYMVYRMIPELTRVEVVLIEVDKRTGDKRRLPLVSEPITVTQLQRNKLLVDVVRFMEQYDEDLVNHWGSRLLHFVDNDIWKRYTKRVNGYWEEKAPNRLIEVTVPPVPLTDHSNDQSVNQSYLEFDLLIKQENGEYEVYPMKAFLTYKFQPYPANQAGETPYDEELTERKLENPEGLKVTGYYVESVKVATDQIRRQQ